MLSDEKFVPTFRILQDFCQWIVYIAEILQNPQAGVIGQNVLIKSLQTLENKGTNGF